MLVYSAIALSADRIGYLDIFRRGMKNINALHEGTIRPNVKFVEKCVRGGIT